MKIALASIKNTMVAANKNQNNIAFGEGKKYENPVNKPMEYTIAALGSATTSGIIGGIVGAIVGTAKHAENAFSFNKKGALIAAGITFALSLPATLYNVSKKVFVEKKEKDIYSRINSTEKSLSERLDADAENEEIPLSESINNLAKFQTGRKGNGIGIMNY